VTLDTHHIRITIGDKPAKAFEIAQTELDPSNYAPSSEPALKRATYYALSSGGALLTFVGTACCSFA
jgi:hypothetical protein